MLDPASPPSPPLLISVYVFLQLPFQVNFWSPSAVCGMTTPPTSPGVALEPSQASSQPYKFFGTSGRSAEMRTLVFVLSLHLAMEFWVPETCVIPQAPSAFVFMG